MSNEAVYLRDKGLRVDAEAKVEPLRALGGLKISKPSDRTPDFVKAKCSINLKAFGEWVVDYETKNPDHDWVNLNVQEPYLAARVSIKLDEFKSWIAEFVKNNPSKEWINFDIKEGRDGGFYTQLDTWEPDKEKAKPSEDSLPDWMK